MMSKSIRWLLCVGFGVVLISLSSALAEEQVFRGELAEGDKIHKDREAFVDYHQFQAKAGQLVTVTMVPEKDVELDTYLYVNGPSGQEYSNDDTYEIGGSQVQFVVPETGEWEIVATALGKDEEGAYVVTANALALKLVLGQRGDLEKGDEILMKRGEYYDKFTMAVEAGKTYVVRAASADFDTFLSVHYPGGLATNDDAEGAYDTSLVIFKAPKAGEATIVMTSSSKDDEGRYRMAAYEAQAVAESE